MMSRLPEVPISMKLRAQAAEHNLDALLTAALPRFRNEWAMFSARGAVDNIGNQFHYKRSGHTPYSELEILMSSAPRYMMEHFALITVNGRDCKWTEAVEAVRKWCADNRPITTDEVMP